MSAHDEVTVENARVDHRLAAHLQHEELAVAGEVHRQRHEIFHVLLREHVDAGGNFSDKRNVFRGAPLARDTRRGVESHFDGTRLVGVALQVAEFLQRGEVVVHRGRRRQPDGLANLAHRRGISALAHAVFDVDENLALTIGESGKR